jgi:hypothetical protein
MEGVVDIQVVGKNKVKIFTRGEKDLRPEIFHLAVAQKWVIVAMGYEDQSIEQVFRELTVEN